MAKYEIVVIIDGTLTKEQAEDKVKELSLLIRNEPNFSEKAWGLKTLAYPIKSKTSGYYYIYNFETEKTQAINEFRRLALINTSVLRHFIKNIEKDYGYRASINEKKITWSKKQQKNYAHKQAILKTKKAVLAKDAASEITSTDVPIDLTAHEEKDSE